MPHHDTAPVTVCIGTYGDRQHWSDLVHNRALPSVDRQTVSPREIRWIHGANLHDARNAAARDATTQWLCFLDADDELDPRYLEAMMAEGAQLDEGDWLLQPATLGVHPDGREDPFPVVIPAKPLLEGNYLIIGTLVGTDQFHRVGGFHDWPMYEDWDLWIRCWRDGAAVHPVPEAIYRVHVNDAGRNSGARRDQVRTYTSIRRKHLATR